ncbi:MAG: 2,4-dienoyl-CoA reductase-like NADH-dependent reductase (Old Yellow Enzyme family) [Granulosicoccus sp.]|jgi:2,4-dienoyl-CoA reductase-like NADH-dependent reductase (Old Yellow Enzyme family)
MAATTEKKTMIDSLLQPLRLGHLTLENRIMTTSHAGGKDDNESTTTTEK